MATFISLHIHSNSLGHITKLLQSLSDADEMIYSSYPEKEIEKILPNVKSDPTCIAFREIENGWTTVYTNSFKKLNLWSETLLHTH